MQMGKSAAALEYKVKIALRLQIRDNKIVREGKVNFAADSLV